MYTANDVSVLIPAFNAEETIERAIFSIFGGSVQPREVIIYDDASSDATLKIARKLEKENEVLKVLSTNKNMGAGFARAELLVKASGKLIAFLDADDIWFPKKLQHQIEFLNSTNADICICNYEIVAVNGNLIGFRYHPRRITYLNMLTTNWVPTSMAIFKSDLHGAKEMPKIRLRQDYAFWLQLFKKNNGLKLVTYPEVLGRYYRSNNSLSSKAYMNIYYNYIMFRREMKFNVIFSVLLLLANVLIRIFRK